MKMTSPASGSSARDITSPQISDEQESAAFQLLHPRLQRWVWEQGWTELRDAQERACAPILSGNKDVIISAATASGKTEAAFLSICSQLLSAHDSAAQAPTSHANARGHESVGR